MALTVQNVEPKLWRRENDRMWSANRRDLLAALQFFILQSSTSLSFIFSTHLSFYLHSITDFNLLVFEFFHIEDFPSSLLKLLASISSLLVPVGAPAACVRSALYPYLACLLVCIPACFCASLSVVSSLPICLECANSSSVWPWICKCNTCIPQRTLTV